MASFGIKYGKLHTYKPNRKGMREMRCTPYMQGALVGIAEEIAGVLCENLDGRYEAGPYDEMVYGVRHNPPQGAHAFVNAVDYTANFEQKAFDSLNWALGAGGY